MVHALHGIGRFLGIRKLELEGVTKDYITIQYAGKENLYVPVTQLDMVTKYIGPREDSNVKLSRLSSPEWQKTRSNVRRAVKDMADELLALYAKREKTKGFAFEPDSPEQHDFEARFPYVETEDQLACIDEIKHDMEQERPMERLLCGDVGFGKTEVALRAAMKCVMSGKQCAILVPTTVLAMQHYQTAVRRFEHFPVNVVMLSRFVPQKRQKEILKEIRSGKADVIIGTHRIVQKDVEFRSLGLAIVDEEQRFGVAHKEKFKHMFAGVDMLTLSATPIPRTLNMAMSGIRDMSVISQPPQDRYPVQTYVMEYSEPVLVQAIQRELKRGGQVYYIHNRIDTIEFTAAKLQRYLPDARILVAHGRMGEAEMSEIWRKLVEHEADILVCTTIIETGVDVPNVNTSLLKMPTASDCPSCISCGDVSDVPIAVPMPISRFSGTRCCGRNPRGGWRRCGNLPSSAAAFTLPCGTWKFAEQAVCWAADSTDTWNPWAMTCTCGCWAKLWRKPGASRYRKRQSAPWIFRSMPIFRKATWRA